MKMSFAVILASLVSISALADEASLIANFKKANSTYKGAFGKNYLQGKSGRSPVGEASESGCYRLGAGGSGLFQAAYRNLIGQALVDQDQFYLANLYTTNYYELMGEYVFGDRCGNHPIDNEGLLRKANEALPKFILMTQHTVLERYYSELFPNTRIGSARAIRGVSDSKDETVFARYYFNFGLTAMNQDIQFLPLYLLSKKSPLNDNSVLQRARDSIATLYTESNGGNEGYAGGDGYLGELYRLRNTIHNTLSKDTIQEIGKFKKRWGDPTGRLTTIQANLYEYFATGAKNVYNAAKRINAIDVMAAARPMIKTSTPHGLLELSNALVAVKNSISDETIFPTESKVDVMILLSVGAQYIAKEINVMKRIDSKETLIALLNAVYIEGFLFRNNLAYFQNQINSAADVATAASVLPKVVAIASKTIEKGLSPALEQWKTVEPKMENFLDNVIKSSTLSAAAAVDAKIKR
jgi:hypothetical protein